MTGPAAASKQRLDRDFTELYRTHLRDVYSYAYYRVGNHHDAEDLTEQAFLQAYRHFERAQRESNGRPLRPWLIRIAHNLAANYYRDRSRRPQTPLDDAPPISALHPTDELVEQREEVRQVLAGVAQLPDDRREALIMRFALDMSNREIAVALGRSEGATKVLIHRAIKQLERGSLRTMAEVGNLDLEQLLRSALAPVDPPEALTDRVERALSDITGAAADELAQWEMETMRDPRNWLPTAAAVVGGGAAAGALILVRARQKHRGRQARGVDALEQSLRSVARDIEKRLGR